MRLKDTREINLEAERYASSERRWAVVMFAVVTGVVVVALLVAGAV